MRTVDAVAAVLVAAPDAVCVASLGTATSALREASGDGPHVYMGGAMGSALAVALGLAERRPDVPVVALLGDGELLMGATSLWSLAGLAPANLPVVVLDDGRYSITGGQGSSTRSRPGRSRRRSGSPRRRRTRPRRSGTPSLGRPGAPSSSRGSRSPAGPEPVRGSASGSRPAPAAARRRPGRRAASLPG
ncbi:MAG: thiamine pyrophosphate-dependent enzyme [Thermoleophilia bacterium]